MDSIVRNPKHPQHYYQWKRPNMRVSVFYGDTLLATSEACILLKEFGRQMHDDLYYFPQSDIRKDLFEASETITFCPLKGDAHYLHLSLNHSLTEDLAWFYPKPINDGEVITNYVAFYPQHTKLIIEPKDP